MQAQHYRLGMQFMHRYIVFMPQIAPLVYMLHSCAFWEFNKIPHSKGVQQRLHAAVSSRHGSHPQTPADVSNGHLSPKSASEEDWGRRGATVDSVMPLAENWTDAVTEGVF